MGYDGEWSWFSDCPAPIFEKDYLVCACFLFFFDESLFFPFSWMVGDFRFHASR